MNQPVYGFASGGQLRFKRAVGHRDLFYIDDKDVDFKDVSSSCWSLFALLLVLCKLSFDIPLCSNVGD